MSGRTQSPSDHWSLELALEHCAMTALGAPTPSINTNRCLFYYMKDQTQNVAPSHHL